MTTNASFILSDTCVIADVVMLNVFDTKNGDSLSVSVDDDAVTRIQ